MTDPSSSFADKSVLSHSPMELTDEEKKRFVAMWDNVPPENTITLNEEESKAFVEKLNSPPLPNERLVKFLTTSSVLESLPTIDRIEEVDVSACPEIIEQMKLLNDILDKKSIGR